MDIRRRGFTLVEMLVVVGIIAILAVVAIPVYAIQMDKSRAAVCTANRRALLSLVVTDALLEDAALEETFNALYPASAAAPDASNRCVCPSEGNYSWQDGRIACDVHDGGGAEGAAKVTLGEYSVAPAATVKKWEDYPAGERVNLVAGQVFLFDDTIYVVNGNRSGFLVTGDIADDVASLSYYITAADSTRTYTKAQISSNGSTCNQYYNPAINSIATSGAIYDYDGTLYIQIKRLSGTPKNISCDPADSPQYWALLGTC